MKLCDVNDGEQRYIQKLNQMMKKSIHMHAIWGIEITQRLQSTKAKKEKAN